MTRQRQRAAPVVPPLLAGCLVAALSGCVVTTSPGSARPSPVDLVGPTPGTTGLPTTKSDFDREIAELEGRLAASVGPEQADIGDACLRIAALTRHTLSADTRDQIGLSRFGYLLLLNAERDCPTERDKAQQWLTGIRAGGPAPVPTDAPSQ